MKKFILMVSLILGIIGYNKSQGFDCFNCYTAPTLEELTPSQLADLVNFYAENGDQPTVAMFQLFIAPVHIEWVFKKCEQIETAARNLMNQVLSNPEPTSASDLASQIFTNYQEYAEGVTEAQILYVVNKIILYSRKTNGIWDGNWSYYNSQF